MHLRHSIFKKLFLILNLISFTEIAVGLPLPTFTPFNWAESKTGYIVKGKVCGYVTDIGRIGCDKVTFVVDTPNNRIFMDLGSLGGQYYLFKDSSFANETLPGSGCMYIPNFNYTDQVAGYKTLFSTPESTHEKSNYIGFAKDVASCSEKISASLTVEKEVLSTFYFSQNFLIEGHGMQIVTEMITFDPATIDKISDRSAYFLMPSSCNTTTINYCDAMYPPQKNLTNEVSKKR